MTRCLYVVVVLCLAAALGFTVASDAAPTSPSSAPTSYLCAEPKTATVGGHSVSTPEVCVPFIQWPPVVNSPTTARNRDRSTTS
ncbi:MAG: hypothetical protein QOJ03_2018 [Frankiaceae bacterium]|jgi:hypothetical protein|nr:hypothetical protein [Frankiaceae bacterium]